MAALIDAHIFWRRLLRLHSSFTSDANWHGVDAISIPLENTSEEASFNKSSAISIHLFGRELPGSLIVLCEGVMHIVASAKKCTMLEALQKTSPTKEVALVIHRTSKEDDNAKVYQVLVDVIKKSRGGTKIGCLLKMQFHGVLAKTWNVAIRSAEFERVDATIALGLSMSTKDEDASSSLRRAAAITHKVLKHGIVRLVEDAFDQAKPITHEELASKAEEFCEDPSKIKLNVPQGQLESCYFPIIQSGGKYDLRPSAATNNEPLSDDVIIVSLGARYKFYCANIARTFFVDPVPKIETTYGILLELRRECLASMLAGHRIGDVAETASKFISHKYPYMLECLPKTLGFGLGLDFREAALLLNSKNSHIFVPNMVFSLAVGFHNVPLGSADKIDAAGSVRKLSKYSMLVADTVIIRADGEPPELLTKYSVEWRDVSYFINESSEDHPNSNYDSDAVASTALASRGAVLSSRLRERAKSIDESTRNGNREDKQIELMRHKLASRRVTNSYLQKEQTAIPLHINVSEIEAYSSTRDYPNDLPPNEIYVDMEGQVVFVPINGSSVPFHISVIKNTVQPDPDRASAYLRLNFVIPGQSLGKDVFPATARVIENHGKSSVFIKEMLYRSRESHRLTAAYRMIQELRKRYRQHAAKSAEEADLVAQENLVKMRDQRIPRMADLTMRPFVSGKKTMGTLEAHTNGLRFISKKHETIDLMYANIKHSLFQPCENEVMVLIHFHLKNPIMIGKKRSHDLQFFTEVVDASVALDNARRSMYDPDELDEEQRERHLRKKLNEMFKEFCKKNGASCETAPL